MNNLLKRLFRKKAFETDAKFKWLEDINDTLNEELHFYKQHVDPASLGKEIECNSCVLKVCGVCGLHKYHLHPLDMRKCKDYIRPTKESNNCHHINVEHLTNPSLIGYCNYTHICKDCGTLLKLQPYEQQTTDTNQQADHELH